MLCQHCQTNNINRPRGLCWTCYYTPGVREQYRTGKFARSEIGNHNNNIEPTDFCHANPGSAEKLAVMCGRAERGENLFHPDEPRGEPSRSRTFRFRPTPKTHRE